MKARVCDCCGARIVGIAYACTYHIRYWTGKDWESPLSVKNYSHIACIGCARGCADCGQDVNPKPKAKR